jgi:glutathione S-transferase
MHVIQLYIFRSKDGAPNGSPFCQKMETFLRAAKVQYEVEYTLNSSAPKRKLPYITIDNDAANALPDTHFIIKHLVESRIAPDLDAPLSAVERADTRAWQAWTEELIANTAAYTKWIVDENYRTSRDETLAALAWPIRYLLGAYVRWKISGALWGQGVGRHSEKEVRSLMQEWVDGVNAKLEDGREWFFGLEQPTTIDVILYAFLANGVGGTKADPLFTHSICEKTRLRAYIRRCTEAWFPEYQKLLDTVKE